MRKPSFRWPLAIFFLSIFFFLSPNPLSAARALIKCLTAPGSVQSSRYVVTITTPKRKSFPLNTPLQDLRCYPANIFFLSLPQPTTSALGIFRIRD